LSCSDHVGWSVIVHSVGTTLISIRLFAVFMTFFVRINQETPWMRLLLIFRLLFTGGLLSLIASVPHISLSFYDVIHGYSIKTNNTGTLPSEWPNCKVRSDRTSTIDQTIYKQFFNLHGRITTMGSLGSHLLYLSHDIGSTSRWLL